VVGKPGSLLAGEYPGHPDPVRARHKVDVLIDAGVRTFVDLTTPADRLDPYEPVVQAARTARNLDLRHLSFPIPDLGVVDDHDYDTVAAIIEEAQSRDGVYVHCWGGIGRTGTVIGCVLVDEGHDYDGVVEQLAALREGTRKARRTAPEMPVQHDLIRRRAAARRRA
jgi:protein-tyrosine phosphatase